MTNQWVTTDRPTATDGQTSVVAMMLVRRKDRCIGYVFPLRSGVRAWDRRERYVGRFRTHVAAIDALIALSRAHR